MNTDSILTRLVETDRKASAMVDNAEEELELTVANMEREIASFKEQYADKAQKRIGIVRDTESRASQEATGNIAQRYDGLMQNLETLYAEKRDNWEDEIFNRCISH
ncbi:MAG: hypothetical protein RR022_06440 [Angelakisella sp.]